MMATDYTPNYNLDLYTSTDKPNLRDQYNAAMGKIDTQMKANADGITNANANVGTLQTQMGQVQGDVSALESTVETHGTQITAAMKNADDALALAHTNETDIAEVESDVTAAVQRIGKLETDNTQIKSDVSTLTARVTSVESTANDTANAVQGKAPTSHASSGTEYGTGNAAMYGHVKVVDSGISAASSGVAASPKMVSDMVSRKPVLLSTTQVQFDNMTETLTVKVIDIENANLLIVHVPEFMVHTSAAIDKIKAVGYTLPEKYRPKNGTVRSALSVSAASITVGMNAVIRPNGVVEISFGAKEAITSGYAIGGYAVFVYGY